MPAIMILALFFFSIILLIGFMGMDGLKLLAALTWLVAAASSVWGIIWELWVYYA